MTTDAYRYNIEPMLFCVTGMVILMCLFATRTVENVGTFYPSIGNGVINSVPSFPINWILFTISVYCPYSTCFTLWGLLISYIGAFSCISLFIIAFLLVAANLAIIKMPIFASSLFVKFKERFNCVALVTLLCYDWFRHGFFLFKKLRLEPVTAQTATGLSNCTPCWEDVNGK